MYKRTLGRLLSIFLAAAGAVSAAHAQTTINVTNSSWVIGADGACTLPEAIQAANTNTTVNECLSGGGPPFTINLVNATYTASTVGDSDPLYGDSAMRITTDVVINGGTASLRQNAQMRIFLVTAGSLTLRNTTVSGGNVVAGTPPYKHRGGGFFVNGAVLNLEDVRVTGNTSSVDGAGLLLDEFSTGNLHRVTFNNNSSCQIRLTTAVMNIANSTIDGTPSAICQTDGSVVSASSVTINSGNMAFQTGALASNFVNVQNSILIGGCNVATFTSTNNSANSGNCLPLRAAPGLGPLSVYGGFGPTFMPAQPNSSMRQAPGCTYLSTGTNPLFNNGDPIGADQRGFARVVACDIGSVQQVAFSPLTLPDGTFNTAYSQTITQEGAPGGSTFGVIGGNGSLPPGLTMSTGGVLSGTPTAAGVTGFFARVITGSLSTEHSYTITIAKAGQTLTFNVQANRTYSAGGTFPITPTASTTSGLAIAYSSGSPAICTVAGTTVTIVSAGACEIRANQTGNGNYNAATQATQTVTIGKANQTITFNTQGGQTFAPGGTFALSPPATAGSGISPVHSSTTPGVCTVAGTTVTIVSAGNCTVAADEAGNGNYNAAAQATQTIAIAKANQTIAFNVQGGQTFAPAGTFAVNPLATTGSGIAPIYSSTTPGVCTMAGTIVIIVSAGNCTIAANQAGNGNYNAALQVTQTVVIGKANQAITFNMQAGQTFAPAGTFPVSPLAMAWSGITPIYSSTTPGVCTVAGTTVTIVSVGNCTIAANEAGNGNYNAAPQVTQTIVIGMAPQVINFTAPGARMLGGPPVTVTATGGGSGNPIVFTSQTAMVCTAGGVNGSTITLLTAGTCTIRASQAGNANYATASAIDRSFQVGSASSGTAVASSANPSSFGAVVTFIATVSGSAPSGTVTFKDGIETICANVPVVNNMATCTPSTLAEGGHSIVAVYSGDGNNVPSSSVALIQVVPDIGKYQGAWWGGASQNGWGMSLIDHGNTLVAGWYFYDAAGQPTWVIMPGCAWTDAAMTTCTGSIQRSKSSWYANYRASQFAPTTVGTATFKFSDPNTATFDYVVNGVSGQKTITRMGLGGNPFAPFDLTDTWWGGAVENGWGVALYQAGGQLVGSWYTYDAQGEPTWLLFNGGTWINDTRFKAQLTRATGSPVLSGNYDASAFRPTVVGELYFDFLDTNNAQMTYVVDGVTQFKTIAKLRF